MSKRYKYRNLPCTVDNLWAVTGQDAINKSAGVLEWCSGQEDAQQRLQIMAKHPQFSNLKAYPWDQSEYPHP